MKSSNPSSPDPKKPRRTRAPKEPAGAKPPSAAAKPGAGGRKREVIPPILLEGDYTPSTSASGPGHRYASGTTSAAGAGAAAEESGDLPESYGTESLYLTARDPHWLYAQWDLSREQLKNYNRQSVDRHLILRIFVDDPGAAPFLEVHLHPESRNWFVHVGRGETKFLGQLGYYNRQKKWVPIATSSPTVTPPDDFADDTGARFVTIPIDVPFQKIMHLVKRSLHAVKPLVEAVSELRGQGHRDLPAPAAAPAGPGEPARAPAWTPQQERALARVLSLDKLRRVWIGSLEITELIRRQLEAESGSAAAAKFSMPSSLEQLSSLGLARGPAPGETFWFQVNAELIVYGATEKDAQVAIDGRPIQLRPDGTFSFRFSLPDGEYALPITARAASGTDARGALLTFARQTAREGDVGAHPQDPSLKTPRPENAV